MAGLLDNLFATPSDQALWALGSGLLGVRRGNEGRALFGAMGAYNDAQQQQRRNALTDAALEETKAQAAQRLAAVEELKRKAMLQSQGMDYLSSGGARPVGSTVIRPETMQRGPQLDPITLIKFFGPEAAQKIMESPNWGRPEVNHWYDAPGPGGAPVVRGMTKFGDQLPGSAPKYSELRDPAAIAAKTGIAAAGANKTLLNVNSFMPFQEELQKDMAKNLATTQDMLKDAPATLQNIEKAKSLVTQSNPFIGSFGDKKLEIAKFFNNNFGTSIAPGAVADAETLRTSLFMQIMDNLKKMDAQPSQMQQIMMKDALGNLNTDPTAIGRVLDVLGETLRNKVSAHNKRVGEFTTKHPDALPYSLTIDMPDFASTTPAGGGAVPYYDKTGKRVR